MKKQLIVAALATLALAACGDEKPSTPAPGAEVSGAPPATTPTPDSTATAPATPAPDSTASAPQSGAVGAAPSPGTGADHATDESDEMTKKEESSQMPQPGQANDHSNTREQGGTGVIKP